MREYFVELLLLGIRDSVENALNTRLIDGVRVRCDFSACGSQRDKLRFLVVIRGVSRDPSGFFHFPNHGRDITAVYAEDIADDDLRHTGICLVVAIHQNVQNLDLTVVDGERMKENVVLLAKHIRRRNQILRGVSR